mmetsp:Transcript_7560/g.18515  ORF Transcript_7560/g.18515 Transcript_7560/m.18515 type:complete len:304 (+) Transcript_7560:248-1159(+)
MMIHLPKGKWVNDVTIQLCRRSRYNLRLRPKQGKEKILIIPHVNKDPTCTRAFILRIINLLPGEVAIIQVILECMEVREDHHLAHTRIPMHIIITTMGTLVLRMIIFVLRILIIIIRCHLYLTQVNQVIMVEEMGITPIHQICLGVRGLLLGIIQMDMGVRILVLRLPWDITVVLLHHLIIVRNKLPIQTRFPLQGVRDQINLILRTVPGRNEQLRAFTMGVKISRFPYHILSDGQTVVLATVLRQQAKLLINLSLSHPTSVRGLLLDHPTIYHLCHALPTFSMKAIGRLLKDQILEIRQLRA